MIRDHGFFAGNANCRAEVVPGPEVESGEQLVLLDEEQAGRRSRRDRAGTRGGCWRECSRSERCRRRRAASAVTCQHASMPRAACCGAFEPLSGRFIDPKGQGAQVGCRSSSMRSPPWYPCSMRSLVGFAASDVLGASSLVVSYRKGQRYLTVVVDHATGLLLWAAPGHDKKTLNAFCDLLGPAGCAALEAVAPPSTCSSPSSGAPSWASPSSS